MSPHKDSKNNLWDKLSPREFIVILLIALCVIVWIIAMLVWLREPTETNVESSDPSSTPAQLEASRFSRINIGDFASQQVFHFQSDERSKL